MTRPTDTHGKRRLPDGRWRVFGRTSCSDEEARVLAEAHAILESDNA